MKRIPFGGLKLYLAENRYYFIWLKLQ